MKLNHLLLLKRKDSEDTMSKVDPARISADPELTALREESAALEQLQAAAPPAPPWDTLRAQVIERATVLEERTMRLTDIFAGRRGWVVRFAAITIVLAVLASGVFAIRSLTPKAWATTNGYVLTFDLPVSEYVDGEDCQCTSWADCPHKYIGDVGRVITAWAKERGEEVGMPPHNDIPGSRLKMFTKTVYSISDEGGDEDYSMEVTLAGFTEEELDSLLNAIRANPVLPEPLVSNATYYHVGEMNGEFAYSFTFAGQTFCFPEYASASDIENQLNAWYESEYGTPGIIEVTIKKSITGGRTITIDGHGSLDDIETGP
jgi:hypothetical protein